MEWMRFFYYLFLLASLQQIPQVAGMIMKPFEGPNLLVVGLNGALQKRFVFAGNLVPGQVIRATQIQTGVGGKGQDVAIALHCLGVSNMRLLQFLGQGPEGDAVDQMLRDQLGPSAVTGTSVRVQSPLRTCTSLVGSDETTELVDPSGVIQADEWEKLFKTCDALPEPTAGLCLMGSLPPGCPPETYANIYQSVATPSTLCVMDSVVGLEPLLGQVRGPLLLKINIHELAKLVDRPDTDKLESILQAFAQKYHPMPDHLQALAITDGKRPGRLCVFANQNSSTTCRVYEVEMPPLAEDTSSTTLYPIGAGDAVAAGTLAAWMSLDKTMHILSVECQEALDQQLKASLPGTESERSILVSFAFGMACGSASCLKQDNSVLDVPDVLRLFQCIKIHNPTLVQISTD